MTQSLPLPYIAHFRIASAGGKAVQLTHPFAIDDQGTCTIEGSAEKVLFHNGHWRDWEDYALRHAVAAQIDVPSGPLSDTRVAAWMASRMGTNWLRFIDTSRFVILQATDKNPIWFYNDGWSEEDGVWYSNKLWMSGRGLQRDYHTTAPLSLTGGYHSRFDAIGTHGRTREVPPRRTFPGETPTHRVGDSYRLPGGESGSDQPGGCGACEDSTSAASTPGLDQPEGLQADQTITVDQAEAAWEVISKKDDGTIGIEEAIAELREWGLPDAEIEDILSLDTRGHLANPKRYRSSGRKGDS